MQTQRRIDFDDLMRHIMFLGVLALAGWSLAAIVGFVSRSFQVEPHATLRFLLAVLVLTFARRTYWEFAEWRWRHLPNGERYGFANPLVEHPRSWESRRTDVEAPQRTAH
jgi:hypothetical protein